MSETWEERKTRIQKEVENRKVKMSERQDTFDNETDSFYDRFSQERKSLDSFKSAFQRKKKELGMDLVDD